MEDFLIYLSYIRNTESKYNQACVQGFLYGWSLYFLECQENNIFEPTTVDAILEYAFGIFQEGPRPLYESLFLKLQSIQPTLTDAEAFVTQVFSFYENDPVQVYTAFEDDVEIDVFEQYLESLRSSIPTHPIPTFQLRTQKRYAKTKNNHGRRAITPIKRHKSGLRGKTLKHNRNGKAAVVALSVPQ
jgi:hypothetical protein